MHSLLVLDHPRDELFANREHPSLALKSPRIKEFQELLAENVTVSIVQVGPHEDTREPNNVRCLNESSG